MPTAIEKAEAFFVDIEKYRHNPEELKKFYDSYASDYNQIFDACGYRDTTDFCANLMKEYLGGVDKEILDVGCGTGTTGASLRKAGFEKVDGVDPSGESRRISKESGNYRNIYDGKITDTQRLSFPDNTYDGVFCLGCTGVGHLKIQDGMPEFTRVLKPGGVAVYIISCTVDKTAVLKDHLKYVEDKIFEIVRYEKRFYFSVFSDKGEKRETCDAYVIKKL